MAKTAKITALTKTPTPVETKKSNVFTASEKKTVLFWFDLFYVVASSVLFLFVSPASQNAFATFQIGAVMPILLAINASIGYSVIKSTAAHAPVIPISPNVPPKG